MESKILFLTESINAAGIRLFKGFEIETEGLLHVIDEINDNKIQISESDAKQAIVEYHIQNLPPDETYSSAVIGYVAYQSRVVSELTQVRETSSGIMMFLNDNAGDVQIEIVVTEYHIVKLIFDEQGLLPLMN